MKPKRKKKKSGEFNWVKLKTATDAFAEEAHLIRKYGNRLKYISGFDRNYLGKEQLWENGSHSYRKIKQPGAE